jgi:hypothetical protein
MRGFKRCFSFIIWGLFAAGFSAGHVFALDARTESLDMFIIIDGSSALSKGKDAAVGWLCDYAVDGILREGDRLVLWLAADPARELFSGTLSGADSKETVKSLLRSLTLRGSSADYTGALGAAAEKEAAAEGMAYTLVISGVQAGYNAFPGSGGEAALLRYSRVLEFPGWRVFAVSQGIGVRARRAAAAFMN